MARLRRVSDGAGDEGACSDAISWNEDGTFKEIVGNRPTVGCSILVGSIIARSYSNQDYWLTTPVTEILEEKMENDLLYVKFKTENSIYEWWGGDTSLIAEMLRQYDDNSKKI
jgi:hypothetical protein